MGDEARVYHFAGNFMECWLEFETSDGLSERSDPVRIDAALFLNSVEEGFDILAHQEGWLVVRGRLLERLDLHLRAEVRVAENETIGWTTPVSHLDLPKRKTSALRFGWANLGNIPSFVVELPGEVGSEFTVFSNTYKETTREAGTEKVVREVTVRLKGRLLGTGQ